MANGTFLALAAAAVVAGIAYSKSKKKEEAEEVPDVPKPVPDPEIPPPPGLDPDIPPIGPGPSPDPEPPPPQPPFVPEAAPAPGTPPVPKRPGLPQPKRTFDVPEPRKPAGPQPGELGGGEQFDWKGHYNANVMQFIRAGAADASIQTAKQIKMYVCRGLFPDMKWPPPKRASAVQKVIWKTTEQILNDIVEADDWGWAGDQAIADRAIRWWLVADGHLIGCQSGLRFDERRPQATLEVCLGQSVFPDVSWPPKASGRGAVPQHSWRWHAWQRIKTKVVKLGLEDF